MALNILRFVTLILAALTLGMGFCHLMEMPARLSWDQSLWVGTTVHGGLYTMFGTIGAVIVIATVVAAPALAWRVRRRGRMVFLLTLSGALMFVLAFAGWWAMVAPVNAEMANWVNGPVPEDWAGYRLRWETGHAVNTMLQFAGFALLVASVLAETRDGAASS